MSNKLLGGPTRTIQTMMPHKLVAALEREAKKRKTTRAQLLRDFSVAGLQHEETNSKTGDKYE
ncbi:MAG: hypothetical protein HOD92_24080 [Deltaproteobacteria bacterium]|jgi:hypothetical protein|nr:hypothetical protein [Deltaproteobacteria bacterium]